MGQDFSREGFEGTTSHSCDEKGRLIIPSKFREIVKSTGNETIVLTKSLDKHLNGYTLDSWEEQRKALDELRIPQAPAIKRLIVGGAVRCTFDKQGRILIQKELREYAGIDKDIKLVGLDKNFEIWSLERWDDVHNMEQESLNNEEVRKELAKLGLF